MRRNKKTLEHRAPMKRHKRSQSSMWTSGIDDSTWGRPISSATDNGTLVASPDRLGKPRFPPVHTKVKNRMGCLPLHCRLAWEVPPW